MPPASPSAAKPPTRRRRRRTIPNADRMSRGCSLTLSPLYPARPHGARRSAPKGSRRSGGGGWRGKSLSCHSAARSLLSQDRKQTEPPKRPCDTSRPRAESGGAEGGSHPSGGVSCPSCIMAGPAPSSMRQAYWAPEVPKVGSISVSPIWFGPPERSLFGWFHRPSTGRARGGVVLCPPFASEHTQAYLRVSASGRAVGRERGSRSCGSITTGWVTPPGATQTRARGCLGAQHRGSHRITFAASESSAYAGRDADRSDPCRPRRRRGRRYR